MLMLFSTVSSSTVTNLFPTLVSTLGYPPTPSLLLTVPPYFLAVLVTFANAWHADRQGERYWHVTLPLYVAIVSFVVSAATGKVGTRYAAMMFMVSGVYASYVVGLAWVSNTLPRPAAKVSDFFPFFFPSNSGREKKQKGAIWCQTSVCFWGEKAGFVVKINSGTIFLLREMRDSARDSVKGGFPPLNALRTKQKSIINLLCIQRAAALAFINAVSNSSSIYASYMYPKSASPRFGKLLSYPTLIRKTRL